MWGAVSVCDKICAVREDSIDCVASLLAHEVLSGMADDPYANASDSVHVCMWVEVGKALAAGMCKGAV